MAASGSALNWLAATVGNSTPRARSRIACLDRLAAAVPAGSDGVLCLPYFLGEKTPIQDPLARGTFTGLSLGHGPAHLWRALLEAVAYGFRNHIDVLAEIGYGPRRFFASDGGTQSAVWMQIVADVLQQPVQLLRESRTAPASAPPGWRRSAPAAASAGATSALLAAWGDTGPAAIVPTLAVYDRGYREYRALYEALKPIFRMRAR